MTLRLDPRIVQTLQAARPQYTDFDRQHRTGYLNSDNTVGADPSAGLDSGFVWLHHEDGRANTRAKLLPLLEFLAHVPNVPVVIALSATGERTVVDADVTRMTSTQFAQVTQARALAGVVPSQNIQGGRVLPSPSGGLRVWVEALPEAGWSGGNLSIDPSDVPVVANTARWAVVYLDADSVTPGYVLTTPEYSTSATSADLPPASAWAAGIPANAYRLGAVTLRYGQTDVSYATSTFVDQRRWLRVGSVLDVSTADVGSPITPTELAAAFPQYAEGLLGLLNDANSDEAVYLVGYQHGKWWFTAMSEAVDVPALVSPADGSYTDDTTPTFDWSD